MPPGPDASFPSSIELPERAGLAPRTTVPLLRVALGAWAALIYLVYWLGYLGAR